MVHTLSEWMTRFGLHKPATNLPENVSDRRHVMVHVTVDAQHATPLRRSLVRDCAGEPWTIRVTPLHDKSRVRLTLILPRTALDGAINHLSDIAPSAQVSGLLEVPNAPSQAWRNLMERSVSIGSAVAAGSMVSQVEACTLSRLLTPDHILLDAPVVDRDALFKTIAGFLQDRHGFASEAVLACLTDRESLGSTALGEGVAVPHGQLDGLAQAMALYIRPSIAILYAAPDGKPVSDVVALFVPERVSMTHLHLLGEVAEHFCDHRFRDQLHGCRNANAVSNLFTSFSEASTSQPSTSGISRA